MQLKICSKYYPFYKEKSSRYLPAPMRFLDLTRTKTSIRMIKRRRDIEREGEIREREREVKGIER